MAKAFRRLRMSPLMSMYGSSSIAVTVTTPPPPALHGVALGLKLVQLAGVDGLGGVLALAEGRRAGQNGVIRDGGRKGVAGRRNAAGGARVCNPLAQSTRGVHQGVRARSPARTSSYSQSSMAVSSSRSLSRSASLMKGLYTSDSLLRRSYTYLWVHHAETTMVSWSPTAKSVRSESDQARGARRARASRTSMGKTGSYVELALTALKLLSQSRFTSPVSPKTGSPLESVLALVGLLLKPVRRLHLVLLLEVVVQLLLAVPARAAGLQYRWSHRVPTLRHQHARA